jgi:hypothetical protein
MESQAGLPAHFLYNSATVLVVYIRRNRVACLPRNSYTIPTSWMVTTVCCFLVTAINTFQKWILSQQPETLGLFFFFVFFELCIVVHLCNKNQQNAHFLH